ncbi:MAG: hypothetical protein JNN30_21950 [Rhodanobacteraceae bacterium]|nr:hypothetical protein [Rhodanobacteraceae bacterium]
MPAPATPSSPTSSVVASRLTWCPTGAQWFAAIVQAVELARSSVDAEFYIWSPGRLASRLGAALVAAASRGCRVRLLLDAYGSERAAPEIECLRQAGVDVAWFNPRRLLRLSFRNHRKLVVVDRELAFLGGCNVADEYDSDGLDGGWRDLGIRVDEPTSAAALAQSFERMWSIAPFDHLPTAGIMPQASRGQDWEVFLAGAGRGGRRYRRQLHRDLGRARRIDVLAAYFVPTTRLRKLLIRVARRGLVRVIVPASGDVPIAQHATNYVLDELSSTPILAYEYTPGMLHAKLVIADDVVYVGSANFDPRSLRINFDVVIRIENADSAAQARAIVDQIQAHSRPCHGGRRGIFAKIFRMVAYVLVAWLDPLIARRKLRLLS